MTALLSASFSIALSVVFLIVAAVASFLCLLAGKIWPAIGWLIGLILCFGLLVLTLGGF